MNIEPSTKKHTEPPVAQNKESWQALWRDLSRSDDGVLRKIPDVVESKIVQLRELEQSGDNYKRVEASGYILRQLHTDLKMIEGGNEYKQASEVDRRAVVEAWADYSCSTRNWGNLYEAISSVKDTRVLVAVVANEISGRPDSFIGALHKIEAPHILFKVREIFHLLNKSPELLHGKGAEAMVDVAVLLYRHGTITELDYAHALGAYAKSPEASIHKAIDQILLADGLLPQKIAIKAEKKLQHLGEMLAIAIEVSDYQGIIRILYGQPAVMLGAAPAFIEKLTEELPALSAITMLQQLCFQTIEAEEQVDKDTFLNALNIIRPALINAIDKLPLPDALEIIEHLEPLLFREGWGQNLTPLWWLISDGTDSDRAPLRTSLMRHILRSPEVLDELCARCELQASSDFFNTSLETIAGSLQELLRDRRVAGEQRISDRMCIAALKILFKLGKSMRQAAPEVGALLGVSVVKLPWIGPVCLPFRIKPDECPAVIVAAKFVVEHMAGHLRSFFGNGLRKRGIIGG